MSTYVAAVLALVVGCKGDAKPKPSPPVVVARDAAVPLIKTALPVATIDGALYYAIDAHVAASIENLDLRAWSADRANDAIGVRPATKPAPPWSLMIGKDITAYTAAGVACPARVAGIALLDRMSAEAPAVLGRLEATGCVPAIVSSVPPKVFAIADASPEEDKALSRVLTSVPGWATYDEQTRRHKAQRERTVFVVRTTPPIGVIAQVVVEERDCGSEAWSVGGAFELRADGPVLLGEIELVERPQVALDTDGDGRPELLYGEAEATDRGQSGGKRYAALRAIGGAAVGDVGLAYYIGCD